jgi:putative DNA primase/helicase
VLCEGPIDTLSATQMFRSAAAVGVLGAGGFKDEWAMSLRGRDVVLAFDPDDPGERGIKGAERALRGVGGTVRQLELPRGMDLNAWMLAENGEGAALTTAFDTALAEAPVLPAIDEGADRYCPRRNEPLFVIERRAPLGRPA